MPEGAYGENQWQVDLLRELLSAQHQTNKLLKQQLTRLKSMANELQNLTTAADRISASANAIIAKLGTPGIAPADVQAQTDRINATSDKIDAAVNPPPAGP
jgi:hypothetical protein